MLKGRLGLDSAKVPYADRAGLLYLARGALTSRDGTLAFVQGPATDADALTPGDVNFRAKLTRDLHRELTHQGVMFRRSSWGQGMCDLLLFPGCGG